MPSDFKLGHYWGALIDARREFCEKILPHDCRLLLFFIQDAAANDWLGLGGREQYIRDGLNLDPKMVEWALEGLQATRPDVAVKFADAVELGQAKHAGPGRGHKTDSNTTRFGRDAAYVQARLERDGHTELLAKIDRQEISANAAAVELGWRHRMIQIQPTVEGVDHAIQRLSEAEQRELALIITELLASRPAPSY